VKTASFFTSAGAGRISIARWAPRGTPAGYRVYKALAPHKSMMGLPSEVFAILYRGCLLRALDARQVWEQLHALAHPHERAAVLGEAAVRSRQLVPPAHGRRVVRRRAGRGRSGDRRMTSAELIAGLVRRHVEGVPLAIDHPFGRRRCLAEIYQTDSGFVFADIGWNTNDTGHPFHAVEGEAVAGDDGQVVIVHAEEHLQGRRSIVYEVRPDPHSDDPAARDAARWRDWLASDDGRNYNNGGRARRAAARAGPGAVSAALECPASVDNRR
jgi:hypothetical protein